MRSLERFATVLNENKVICIVFTMRKLIKHKSPERERVEQYIGLPYGESSTDFAEIGDRVYFGSTELLPCGHTFYSGTL